MPRTKRRARRTVVILLLLGMLLLDIVMHTSNLIDEFYFISIFFSEHDLCFKIFLSKTIFYVFKIIPNVHSVTRVGRVLFSFLFFSSPFVTGKNYLNALNTRGHESLISYLDTPLISALKYL